MGRCCGEVSEKFKSLRKTIDIQYIKYYIYISNVILCNAI